MTNSAPPVRVLHLLGTAQPGGVESYVRDVVSCIDRDRFELSVCILGADGPVAREIREAGVHVTFLGRPGLRDPKTLARYFSLIKTRRPQILHANTGGRAHWVVARMGGCRRVIAHFHAFPEEWMDHLGRDEATLRARVRRMSQSSDVILACSDWLASEIRRLLAPSEGDVRYMPPGVLLERWNMSVASNAQVEAERSALAIPAGAAVVGFLGRFVRQKGLPHVLELARVLESRAPAAVVVLVGTGPLEASVREAAEKLTNVRFAGVRSHPQAVMSLFDVTIMPSEWEPFGIVALESFALAKPVVCFAVNGLPEIVVDGETGIGVDPGDDGALAEGVISLLENPELAKRLGDNGLRRAQAKFDIRRSIQALEAVYDSLT